MLRLVDGDGDGGAGTAVGVGGVKRVDGGLRGRDGDAGASDGAGIWGNNHIRNAAYQPGKVTGVPAEMEFVLAVKEVICGTAPLGTLF